MASLVDLTRSYVILGRRVLHLGAHAQELVELGRAIWPEARPEEIIPQNGCVPWRAAVLALTLRSVASRMEQHEELDPVAVACDVVAWAEKHPIGEVVEVPPEALSLEEGAVARAMGGGKRACLFGAALHVARKVCELA
ncbi:MAG: hypothetical protein QXU79_00180 [Candidatus Micrarchaeaceae archaeon]